jgi:tetratricopeptide (TPR) repeat protein
MRLSLFYLSSLALFGLFTLNACNDTPSLNAGNDPNQRNEPLRDAIDSLNQVIVQRPNDAQPFLERARVHFLSGNNEDALDDVNRALRLDSANAKIVFERGELHFSMMKFDLAKADYERCLTLDPQSIDCMLKLGEMDIHLRNYSSAIERINTALRIDDQLAFAYYMKGRIYKETGDTVLAASSYQTAIEVSPDYYDAYIEAGLLYVAAKNDLAIDYFNTALELRPNSVEALYNLAYYYTVTGTRDPSRFAKAFSLYDRISEEDPNNATAPYNKGYIHLEYLQNYDSAALYFSQATELHPGYFQAYYNRGLALESMNRDEEALADYNRALALKPNFTEAAIAKGRVLGE